MPSSTTPPESSNNEQFVQLFSRYQRRIHAFIGTMLPNPADVEDVMSETSIILWRKWDSFERDADFVRWACGIARLEVFRFRRQNHSSQLIFSEPLIDDLAVAFDRHANEADRRQLALDDCIDQLRPRDREIIQARYDTAKTIRQVAVQLGRPETSIYKAWARIRRTLFECVQRKLAQEESL